MSNPKGRNATKNPGLVGEIESTVLAMARTEADALDPVEVCDLMDRDASDREFTRLVSSLLNWLARHDRVTRVETKPGSRFRYRFYVPKLARKPKSQQTPPPREERVVRRPEKQDRIVVPPADPHVQEGLALIERMERANHRRHTELEDALRDARLTAHRARTAMFGLESLVRGLRGHLDDLDAVVQRLEAVQEDARGHA